jgi:membrane protease YdiL (CAAX protease family)
MESSLEERDSNPGVSVPLWLPLVGLGVGIVLATLFSTVAIVAQHASVQSALDSPATLAADEVGLWIALVGSALLASRRYGTRHLGHDFGLKIRPWPDIPLGLLIGVICQLVVVPVLYLPFEIGNSTFSRTLSQPAKNLVGVGKGEGSVVVALIVLVGAPLIEELFFRGLLLSALRSTFRHLPSRLDLVVSIVSCGAIFGLAHFELLQFLGLFAVGVIFAALTTKVKRLGLTIFAHCGFNLVAFLLVTRV